MALRQWLDRHPARLYRGARTWFSNAVGRGLSPDREGDSEMSWRRSRCQYCAKPVSATTRVCPHCQAILTGGWRSRGA